MKVIVCIGSYTPDKGTGATITGAALAKLLTARGHEVTVLAMAAGAPAGTTFEDGLKIVRIRLRNLWHPLPPKRHTPIASALWYLLDTYNPFMARFIGKILDAERPDVLNLHEVWGYSAIALWREASKRGIPVVHSLHGHDLICPNTIMWRAGRRCPRQCLRCRVYSAPRKRLQGLVSLVTSPSQYLLNRHEEYGYFERIPKMLIRNPYSGHLDMEDHPRRLIHQPLRFGFIGILHPIKGVDLLIRSFAALPSGAAELCIAGSGARDYEQYLRTLAPSNSSIHWLGFTAPNQFFPRIDVLVVPSACQEVIARVITESLACGVPVIASSRGGIPEAIPAGAGWLFEPEEDGALTHLLRSLVETPSQIDVAAEHCSNNLEEFSDEAVVAGYLEAYRRAIERTKSTELARVSEEAVSIPR